MGESADPHVQATQSPEDGLKTHKQKDADKEAMKQGAIPETKPLDNTASRMAGKIFPSVALEDGKALPFLKLGNFVPNGIASHTTDFLMSWHGFFAKFKWDEASHKFAFLLIPVDLID